MNTTLGKKPIQTFNSFSGLWARGSDYTCPPDHLTECYNCSFPGPGQISIRENYTVQNDIAGRTIISFAIATLSAGPVLLTLNADGKLYDETAAALLGTFANADDFVCLSLFGRAYISLKQKGKAYPGGSLYWYDGITFHTAGWAAPGSAVTLTQPNAGIVDAGVHTVAVSFVSSTGNLSKPSAVTTITSDGAHTISISAIPTGPTGTTGRVILVSQANKTELFFAPGGTINDNVTTTFEYTKSDSALIVSADYLNNLLFPLPSCAALKFYSGRLVVIGRDAFPDEILVSNQADPETFNLVNNVINLPVDYGYNTSAGGMVIRDVLYLTKPNSTFAVQDNGDNPNTWRVSVIDSGIGAFDNGISVFASSMSAQDTMDSSIIASKRGLMFFNGAFAEIPLTFKIESIWQKIVQGTVHQIQVAHDIWTKRVYVAVPLAGAGTRGQRIAADGGGVNNIILMMDYQEGLDALKVRWSVWTMLGPFRKIGVENFLLNYSSSPIIYQLAIARGDTMILKIVGGTVPGTPDTGHSGATFAIDQYLITAPVAPGGVWCFNSLNFVFAAGNKALTPSLMSKSRVGLGTDQRPFALDTYDPAVELTRGINFQSTGLEVLLYASQSLSGGSQGYFHLTKLDVYGNFRFAQLPAVQESA